MGGRIDEILPGDVVFPKVVDKISTTQKASCSFNAERKWICLLLGRLEPDQELPLPVEIDALMAQIGFVSFDTLSFFQGEEWTHKLMASIEVDLKARLKTYGLDVEEPEGVPEL
jgi:hypothetical protein